MSAEDAAGVGEQPDADWLAEQVSLVPKTRALFENAVSDTPLHADWFAESVSDRPFYADAYKEEVEAYLAAERACQGPGVAAATCRPWAGTDRAADHDALDRRIRQIPEGAPVLWLARELFGDDVASGDADFQFVRRHAERYHEVFYPRSREVVAVPADADADAAVEYEIQAVEGATPWVRPRSTPTAEVLDSTGSGTSERGSESGTVEPASVAARNAAGRVRRRAALDGPEAWAGLVGSLAAKRQGEERGGEQRTRFNDVGRARKAPNRVAVGFAGAAAAGFERGVVVTATTHAQRYDSIADAADGLLDDVDALRRWLGRPPGVTAVEPTQRGVPHAHVALFTDPDEFPGPGALHDYWEGRGRAQQIEAEPIHATDGGWAWSDGGPDDAGEGCPPAAYVSEGPMVLPVVARCSSEALHAVVDAYDARATDAAESLAAVDAAVAAETGVSARAMRWAAWYFATELRPATPPSPVLRKAVGGGD